MPKKGTEKKSEYELASAHLPFFCKLHTLLNFLVTPNRTGDLLHMCNKGGLQRRNVLPLSLQYSQWLLLHSCLRNACLRHVSRDQCPVPSDDDTASQGKGDSLLESLGRSLHPDPMKVRKDRQVIGQRAGLVTHWGPSFLCILFLLPWFLSD